VHVDADSCQGQPVHVPGASEDILRQRRTVVRQMGLCSDHGDGAGVALLAKRFDGAEAGK
jgi:hypothetical protein